MKDQINNTSAVKEQYKTDDNLNARISIYKYNINKEDWNVWCFERMDIPEHGKVLELGSGNGILWQKNEKAIKETWEITLSDLSEGMLQSAKQNIKNANIKYEIFDVQDIPYEDNSFDIVIARHMLYHVPDIAKALSEIKRVMKPDGKLYITTNSKKHLQELEELVNGFDKAVSLNLHKFADIFGIENGGEMLKKYFNKVALEEFNGQLVIDKAEPILEYINSGFGTKESLEEKGGKEKFYQYVQEKLDRKGAIKITTKSGMFIVSN